MPNFRVEKIGFFNWDETLCVLHKTQTSLRNLLTFTFYIKYRAVRNVFH